MAELKDALKAMDEGLSPSLPGFGEGYWDERKMEYCWATTGEPIKLSRDLLTGWTIPEPAPKFEEWVVTQSGVVGYKEQPHACCYYNPGEIEYRFRDRFEGWLFEGSADAWDRHFAWQDGFGNLCSREGRGRKLVYARAAKMRRV